MIQLADFILKHPVYCLMGAGALGYLSGIALCKAVQTLSLLKKSRQAGMQLSNASPAAHHTVQKPKSCYRFVDQRKLNNLLHTRRRLLDDDYIKFICDKKVANFNSQIIQNFISAKTERQRNLIALRLSLGMTQRNFALSVQISQAEICRLEKSNHNFYSYKGDQIARAHNLPLWLFCKDTDMKILNVDEKSLSDHAHFSDMSKIA